MIDLSNLAAQPMSNEDGSLWLVYNGEIYNYLALRNQLYSAGHSFTSVSDSEVVLKAYANWGDDCVHHLRGIFAFAIWDVGRHRLFMARDPLGVKPFYHGRSGDCFAFASQPKAIISAPGWPRQADPTAFRDYLAFGYIPYDRCAFSGLAKLPAGHRAVYTDGDFKSEAYWLPTATTGLCNPKAALESQLIESVSSQLVADVPVGCFLSGGIDSSLLVALSTPHRHDLRTFTVGFDDPASDERSFARRIAMHFDTIHADIQLTRDSLETRLLKLPYFFDEPFDPNGALPFLAVACLAREHNTVVALGGDGADELFAGYLRYDDFDRPAQLGGAVGGVFLRLLHALRRQNLLSPRPLKEVDLPRYFEYEGCLDNANCFLTPHCQARVEAATLIFFVASHQSGASCYRGI
ncbi:MAG: asparagine synthase (glutamine-hydrolyzing) [Propionivibrio sp.]|nr:asparagine synthase (glutamine-hydrolyzing) [Propionivibrio sp.]